MRKHLYIAFALSLLLMVMPSCKMIIPEADNKPAAKLKASEYASCYDFGYIDTPFGTQYLVPVVRESISKTEVQRIVKGQGWETAAVYRIGMDKEVITSYVLVTGSQISSEYFEILPDRLIFSADANNVTFYEPPFYETDRFAYDETDNSITLPLWFGSWAGRGRLVFLSDDIMVLVCTHDKDYKGEDLIFMEIMQRVSSEERQSWIDNSPHYGIRV